MISVHGKRSVQRSLLLHLLALLLLLVSTSAMCDQNANCSGGGKTATIGLPATITVSRDTPVGGMLTNWVMSDSFSYSCEANFGAPPTGVSGYPSWPGLTATQAPSPTPLQGGGSAFYIVYQTNVAGVGVAMAMRWTLGSCGLQPWTDFAPGNVNWKENVCNSAGWPDNSLAFAVALVKTGPTSSGSLSARTIAEVMSVDKVIGSKTTRESPRTSRSTLLMKKVDIVSQACTTPDITVPLGNHSIKELKGPNTFTSATTRSFKINNCPTGMKGIKYRIDPPAGIEVLDPGSSVVGLLASKTGTSATGVGVQLLDKNNVPMPLKSDINLSDYNSSIGGDYSFDIKARYYQTAPTITPGDASTYVTVTMQYL